MNSVMLSYRTMYTRFHISIGVLSVALIAFQLILMQFLSIVQWHHFAYMVISVALLGFGSSGAVIAVARGWFLKREEFIVPLLMIACGSMMALVIRVSQFEYIRFDSYLLFVDSRQVRALLLTYCTLFVPFFLGALALGVLFVTHVGEIGHLYSANLVGSGFGGVFAIGLLWMIPAEQAAAVLALLPVFAGLLLLPDSRKAGTVFLAFAGCAVTAYSFLFPPHLVLSEYKSLSRTMNVPDARVVYTRSSPYGFVQVVSSQSIRYAPGLSLAHEASAPITNAVFSNGDWYGPIVTWSRGDTANILDYTTGGLPYAMKPRGSVLVLQAKTGIHIAHAAARGAHRIVAVEPDAPVVSMLHHEFATATDSLFYHPSVKVYTIDPRAHLVADTSTYDLIVMPTLDAFGGTAGLYALQEQYLFTTESCLAMWNRLAAEGVMCVTSWMDHPVRNPLRALAMLCETLRDAGVKNPIDHIAAARSWGTITFVAKRTPLTQEEMRNIRMFCTDKLFDPVLMPHLMPSERARFNQVSDESFFRNLDEVVSSRRTPLYEDYDFDIRPATDDRPYFSQFLRWRSLTRLRQLFGDQSFPFLELGSLIVAVTFVQIVIVALVLIFVPLLRIGLPAQGRVWALLYFGAIGVGYMFMEIVLIQRFVLYFGQPIYAAAAVIGGLLCSSGVGSYFSSRVPATSAALWKIVGLAAVVIVLYGLVLMPLLRFSAPLPMAARVFLAILLIALPGIVMGMPFPLGLRVISSAGEGHVAWAWGINGCMSVVSTALATIIAVSSGFSLVIIVAAIVYGTAAACTALQR